jgi:hypothetical protein
MSKKLPHNMPKGKPAALSNPRATDKHSKLTNVDPKDRKPSISLKYIDLNFYSFEDLKDDYNLKHFDAFLKKLNNATSWETFFQSCRKDSSNKAKSTTKIRALGYNPSQIEMFHFRVTREFRVHGFLIDQRFKLVWLDPKHEIDKE